MSGEEFTKLQISVNGLLSQLEGKATEGEGIEALLNDISLARSLLEEALAVTTAAPATTCSSDEMEGMAQEKDNALAQVKALKQELSSAKLMSEAGDKGGDRLAAAEAEVSRPRKRT